MKKTKERRHRKSTQKNYPSQTYRGIFKSHDYYGFIENPEKDLYVRWENINTALNKDTVEYVIIENEDGIDEKRTEAKIIQVLERAKSLFVGELIHKELNKFFVLLENNKLNKVVTTPAIKGAEIGTKVKVKINNFHLDDLRGDIVKVLGHKQDPGIEIKTILEDFGITEHFSDEIESIVKKIDLDIQGHRKDSKRLDFLDIPLITIDPEDSKDFDDAIGVLKEGENYHLYVAIADVWSYIKQHPSLIKEAENRSTSIYFLNSVIPMLPEKLCNLYCSLVPNEERCALVLDIFIDKNGKILWDTTNINPAIIRSRRRCNYEEINDFFEGKDGSLFKFPEIQNLLKNSHALFKLLENQRRKKGYVSLENSETKIKLDENGKILSVNRYIRKDSQFMIENFMILANEGVARYLRSKKIPALFRTHDRPEPSKLAFFISEAKKLNFKIKDGDEKINQKVIFRWFEENKNHPLIEEIGVLLLRSLQKAIYSVHDTGHFGLNLDHYLHFTSPIRRYPDTIVHKMLWEYVFENKPIPKEYNSSIYKELDEIAKHCTEKEIEATEISRSIENAKMIQFLNTKLEHVFKAKVVSPSKFGGFVKLENLNIEGIVKCRDSLKLGDCILVKPIYNSREFRLIKHL